MMTHLSPKKVWLINTLLATAYIIFGHLAFSISVSSNTITSVIFIPEGISLAFAILYGYRVWPGVFIGQLILALSTQLPWAYSLSIAITNSLEALLAAWIFTRWAIRPQLDRLHDSLQLLLVIPLVLQPFSALCGVLPMWLGGRIADTELLNSLFHWWLGNSMGQWLLAPLVLSWSTVSLSKVLKISHYREILFVSAAIIFMTLLSFGSLKINWETSSLYIFILMYPTLCLTAVRYRIHGTSWLCFLAVIVGTALTSQGIGPFAAESGELRIVFLNTYIIGVTLTSLLIATLFSERKTLHKSLLEMAYTDSLTGAANRRAFLEIAEREILRSKRYQQPVSVILFDLDKFKLINDNYGHQAGDFVLTLIVKLVNENIRDVDTLGRIGGDEFILLLPNITLTSAKILSARLEDALANTEESVWQGKKIQIGASFGVGQIRDDETWNSFFQRVDQEMYSIKAQHHQQTEMPSDIE